MLDIATSLASNGAIRKDGSPITDPKRINDGTYLPMGDYKGSGLSIIIGLLAGPLNGAAFGRDIRDFAAPVGGDLNVGQFIIALDVARAAAGHHEVHPRDQPHPSCGIPHAFEP